MDLRLIYDNYQCTICGYEGLIRAGADKQLYLVNNDSNYQV